MNTLPLSVRICCGTPISGKRGGQPVADGLRALARHQSRAHIKPAVAVDAGQRLGGRPVGKQKPADRIHLHYNAERTHQSLGDLTPAQRFGDERGSRVRRSSTRGWVGRPRIEPITRGLKVGPRACRAVPSESASCYSRWSAPCLYADGAAVVRACFTDPRPPRSHSHGWLARPVPLVDAKPRRSFLTAWAPVHGARPGDVDVGDLLSRDAEQLGGLRDAGVLPVPPLPM